MKTSDIHKQARKQKGMILQDCSVRNGHILMVPFTFLPLAHFFFWERIFRRNLSETGKWLGKDVSCTWGSTKEGMVVGVGERNKEALRITSLVELKDWRVCLHLNSSPTYVHSPLQCSANVDVALPMQCRPPRTSSRGINLGTSWAKYMSLYCIS